MMHPFVSAPVFLLLLGLATEAFYGIVRWKTPHVRVLCAARLAAWFMRPLMAAAAANVVFGLLHSQISNRATYPLYANLWDKKIRALDAFRYFWAGEGLKIWLPIAGASGLLFAIVGGVAGGIDRARLRAGPLAVWLVGLVALAQVFWVSIGSLPNGCYGEDGQTCSFLLPWHQSGSTMLYATKFMKPDAASYLRNFDRIQARLDHVIHAKSHPPFASLAVRWIGAAAGVNVAYLKSFLDPEARLRYALGQTVVSSLNLVVLFFLGAALFNRRTGLLAATLWGVAPSVVHYSTFAPDMNYALFFHGALLFSWCLVSAPTSRRALAFSIPLGLCFAALVLLTYSWCIITAFFAVFAGMANLRAKAGWRDAAWRIVPPLAVMVLAAGSVMLCYHMDYLAMYRNSSVFVAGFYHHKSFLEAACVLVGGQIEWLILAGPLACSGFFAFCRTAFLTREWPLHRLFVGTFFAILALPFVFGPPALKHEVARCWIWVAAVPIVFASHFWTSCGRWALCGIVVASSAALAVFLRFFFCFLA